MDKDIELLRNEVNYLLFTIETCLGTDIKTHAEDALNYTLYCFFFNKQDLELYRTVDRLEIYISYVNDEYKEIYPTLKKNISQILKMITLIKREHFVV